MSRSNYVFGSVCSKEQESTIFPTKQKVKFESKQEVMLRGTGSDASRHKSVIFRRLWLLYGLDSFTGSNVNSRSPGSLRSPLGVPAAQDFSRGFNQSKRLCYGLMDQIYTIVMVYLSSVTSDNQKECQAHCLRTGGSDCSLWVTA